MVAGSQFEPVGSLSQDEGLAPSDPLHESGYRLIEKEDAEERQRQGDDKAVEKRALVHPIPKGSGSFARLASLTDGQRRRAMISRKSGVVNNVRGSVSAFLNSRRTDSVHSSVAWPSSRKRVRLISIKLAGHCQT